MIDVLNDSLRELQAVVLAMKAADRSIKREINKRTRDTMNPVWKSLVEANQAGLPAAQVRLLGGVRIKAGNPPVAQAAQSRRAIGRRKDLRPVERYYLAEFGVGDREAYSVYDRKSPKGKVHKVKRRTMRAWPARTPDGRVVYPAFEEFAPRAVSLWVQTVMRTYFDAAEGKRGG